MAYSVFFTKTSTSMSRKKPSDFSALVPSKVDTLGAAIDLACQLIREGAMVWRIQSREGLLMERADIELECDRRKGKQS